MPFFRPHWVTLLILVPVKYSRSHACSRDPVLRATGTFDTPTMQVQRLAHGTEAHSEPQQHKHAQRGPEWPPSRRSELLRATHAQHPARIATAAPAISTTAASSRAAPASPTLESASDFAWRARPESLDDITSFGRRDPRRRKLVGRPAVWASSATGCTINRIAASSGKRGHAPATGDHFAGRPFRQRPWGPLPNVEIDERHPGHAVHVHSLVRRTA